MMSEDEVNQLKKIIFDLENQLKSKSAEVITYRNELQKISQKLDFLMSQMSKDNQVLAQIQKTLVPTELPKIPGFEFSRKFVFGTQSGGDYFDIFEHEDKLRFGVLVSSSSGYAMSALFLSLILKVSHILEAKKGQPPEKVLQQMAQELKKLASANDFTNVFYAVIDRRDYSCQFSGAGQIQAFYVNRNKSLQLLKTESSPFSPNFLATLRSAQLAIEPFSKICILTDGLMNILGLEKATQIITDHAKSEVHLLRNELLFQAQKISGLAEPTRDQTVVVIEAKDQVIKLAK